jgi:hypothetical protein
MKEERWQFAHGWPTYGSLPSRSYIGRYFKITSSKMPSPAHEVGCSSSEPHSNLGTRIILFFDFLYLYFYSIRRINKSRFRRCKVTFTFSSACFRKSLTGNGKPPKQLPPHDRRGASKLNPADRQLCDNTSAHFQSGILNNRAHFVITSMPSGNPIFIPPRPLKKGYPPHVSRSFNLVL